jgi:hypothetical protein
MRRGVKEYIDERDRHEDTARVMEHPRTTTTLRRILGWPYEEEQETPNQKLC